MKTFHRMLTATALAMAALTATAQGPNESGRYYQTADGKKGQELKTALASIILPHKQLSYAKVWEAYKTTDVRSDGYIWDMYSTVTNYVPGDDQNRSGHAKEGDNYDREHSFPKSWFGGKVYPMFTDIFHLYPVDGYTNGRRSNNPYGEVAYLTWATAEEFSKLGQPTSTLGYPGNTVFEPNDEYKGDLARTYFYMVTCYEEQLETWNYAENVMLDKTAYPAFEPWALRMLLRWAQNDPVSDKERARNEAVCEIQGNRNPFIDYPGLEQYIWGTARETPFSYDYYEGVKQGEAVDEPIGETPTEEPDAIDEDDILLNNDFFGVAWTGSRTNADPTAIDGEKEGVSVTYDKGKGSAMYCNDTQIRLYQKNTLTMAVKDNRFKEIEFTVTYNKGEKALAADVGEMNGFSWTGDNSEVVFTVNDGSGHLRITGVSYTLAETELPTAIQPDTMRRQQATGIYSPDGRRLSEMQQGLNIIRLPDGRTIKVIK